MDFSEVFCIYRSKAVIVGSLRDFPENIDRISTFPHQISGRVSSYNAIYGRDERNYVCSSTSTPITFDFRREYGENLIVHEQCGGGLWGVELFSKIQAKNWLREEMIGKLELIKKYMPYIGVHLRFSDYKCDYGGFLSYLSQKVRGRNVLICSDSLDVRRDSVDILGGNNVFFVSDEIDTGGAPIHSFVGSESEAVQKHALLGSFFDLLGLSQAEVLIFPKLTNGGLGGYSGFSLLAKGVKDRKLMDSFLNL